MLTLPSSSLFNAWCTKPNLPISWVVTHWWILTQSLGTDDLLNFSSSGLYRWVEASVCHLSLITVCKLCFQVGLPEVLPSLWKNFTTFTGQYWVSGWSAGIWKLQTPDGREWGNKAWSMCTCSTSQSLLVIISRSKLAEVIIIVSLSILLNMLELALPKTVLWGCMACEEGGGKCHPQWRVNCNLSSLCQNWPSCLSGLVAMSKTFNNQQQARLTWTSVLD